MAGVLSFVLLRPEKIANYDHVLKCFRAKDDPHSQAFLDSRRCTDSQFH
jgi:hypothetical protein